MARCSIILETVKKWSSFSQFPANTRIGSTVESASYYRANRALRQINQMCNGQTVGWQTVARQIAINPAALDSVTRY